MSKKKLNVKRLVNLVRTTKDFDPEAFVMGIRKPISCSIPEWAEANHLISIYHEMGNAQLSRAEQEAVFRYLKLTPEMFDEKLADGFAAVAEAYHDTSEWDDEMCCWDEEF